MVTDPNLPRATIIKCLTMDTCLYSQESRERERREREGSTLHFLLHTARQTLGRFSSNSAHVYNGPGKNF